MSRGFYEFCDYLKFDIINVICLREVGPHGEPHGKYTQFLYWRFYIFSI